MREITGSTVQAKVKTNDRLTPPNRQGALFPTIGNRIPSRREQNSRLLGISFLVNCFFQTYFPFSHFYLLPL